MKLNAEEMTTVTRRLKRAQGQIGGIIKMIEEGRECSDIVTQIAAVSKAVDRAAFSVVACGLEMCLEAESKGETPALDRARLEKLFLSLA